MSISEHMTSEHKRCDLLYLAAEKAVMEDDWDTTREQYQLFHQSMQQHFEQEETVLFPDFEQVQGSTMGPTQVMRMEHEQMRQLFSELAEALENRDKDGYLGLSETLMILMQQHNMKEEQVLYRMMDQVYGEEVNDLLKQAGSF